MMAIVLAEDIVLNEAWTLNIINLQDKPWEERYGKTPLMRNIEVITDKARDEVSPVTLPNSCEQ